MLFPLLGIVSRVGVRARTPAFGLIAIGVVIIGIRLQTWMQVIVGVDVYARLSLEIKGLWRANYIEWPLPGPGSRAAVTLSPSLRADLLGCINRTRERKEKGSKH